MINRRTTFSEVNVQWFEKLRSLTLSRSHIKICLLIFLTCVFVYEANDRVTLTSSDNVTHTLLAFNWLENHTLNFDAFRDGYLYEGGGIPYYLVEAPNGHLTSRYPVGTALVTFPLYCLFYIYLKVAAFAQTMFSGSPSDLLDITSEEFDVYRRSFGKLAATLSSALSVVIFYLCARLKFNQGISIISTFVFAFATGTWVLCSQDLRQHTLSNLLLVSIILCLMKAERSQERKQRVLLLIAGLFCGLLPGVRITSTVFSVATTVYVIWFFRRKSIFFLLGLPSVLFNLAWNFYYFGWDNLIVGGYVKHLEERPVSYAFTLKQFTTASLGLLVSPSDGFFVYSPVLLFSIPGIYQIYKFRAGKDEKLLLCLTFACAVLYLHYCFYLFWMGGSDSYGSRVMTDTLPIVCLAIGYFLVRSSQALHNSNLWSKPIFALFCISLLFSVGVQTIGAFTQTNWGTSPLPIFADKSRVWSLKDSQIERHFRNFVAQITNPIKEEDEETYIRNLNATIENIEIINKNNQQIIKSLIVPSGKRKILSATLRNTGRSPWFGYQTGLENSGETRIRVRFYDGAGNQSKQRGGNLLYISGTPRSGEQTQAIGLIAFPKQPGDYEIRFELIATGISSSSDSSPHEIYRQSVTVKK